VVSRKNIAFGISDKIMVLFGSALADGVNQFKLVIASLFIYAYGCICENYVQEKHYKLEKLVIICI